MGEVKESLRALYLDNDSSSFQHLLGFTEVVNIFNEDEFKSGKGEVFEAAEVNINDANGPIDSKNDLHDKIWNINNVNDTEVTESEESTNYLCENKLDTETLECSQCEYKCKTEVDLKQHKLTFHKGEERSTSDLETKKDKRESLSCAKCVRKFRHGGAFRRHKVIHHGENEEEVEKDWEILQQNFRWSCEVCGKKFLDQHNLKVHKRKEHPVKRNNNLPESLDCVQCNKKFRYGRAFRRHKIIEHGENEEEVKKEWETLQENFQWPCEICGNKFWDQHNLRIHKKREHPVKRIIDENEKGSDEKKIESEAKDG